MYRSQTTEASSGFAPLAFAPARQMSPRLWKRRISRSDSEAKCGSCGFANSVCFFTLSAWVVAGCVCVDPARILRKSWRRGPYGGGCLLLPLRKIWVDFRL